MDRHPLSRFAAMSVLVVDDVATNVEVLCALLRDFGLERVTGVTDPREVAGLLPRVRPDLVLLDLHMPQLDGLEVLGQVERFAGGTYLPVLVLTGDTSRQARDRAFTEGARDFLTKPFDAVEVVLRAANLLETRELYCLQRQLIPARTVQPAIGDAPVEGRRARLQQIQQVLDEGGPFPVYQPVVDLGTDAHVGHEALSRFPRPHLGGPAGWFAQAEEVGLGVELEWQAAQRALPFLDHTPESGYLAVNLSPAAVMELTERALLATADCARLVIELTEHVPVEDYGALRRALAPLREQGARLAVDDLGSGYAGFRHLVALEADIIKLDISIVETIESNQAQRALARALTAFAADVGATVIAEGVEREQELAVLREIGVESAQGFLLGRPAPMEIDLREEPLVPGA